MTITAAAVDADGRTPLHLAAAAGHQGTAGLLVDYGAKAAAAASDTTSGNEGEDVSTEGGSSAEGASAAAAAAPKK